MSDSRRHFGDRSFRGRRFTKYVPISRHSIFIRQLPASVSPKAVRNFFAEETNENVEIDFVSYTDDRKKLCIAVRFDSHYIAKDMIDKFNNREILGHQADVTWYKDLKSVKDRYNRRGRYPRRGGRYRSMRSSSRNYRRRDSSRDRKHRSRSGSSSSSSKSRSGSESDSARSSGSPTRMIRKLQKEKMRRRGSRDSYVGRDRSHNRTKESSPPRRWLRDVSESSGPVMYRSKKSPKDNIESPRPYSQGFRHKDPQSPDHSYHNISGKYTKSPPVTEPPIPEPIVVDNNISLEPGIPPIKVKLDDPNLINQVRTKSEEILENYHKDIEKYLNFVNTFVAKNNDLEMELVNALNGVLTEVGEGYVTEFIEFIDIISK